jgi:hypothetical protein
MCIGHRSSLARSSDGALFACLLALFACGCVNAPRDVNAVDGGKGAGQQFLISGIDGTPQQVQQRDLAAEETIALATTYYDQGNYPAVIGILTVSRDLPRASIPVRIRAKKLLAFSHCIDGRTADCEKYFEEILELDPRFELTPFETGNPVWDPAFRRAKRAPAKKKGA